MPLDGVDGPGGAGGAGGPGGNSEPSMSDAAKESLGGGGFAEEGGGPDGGGQGADPSGSDGGSNDGPEGGPGEGGQGADPSGSDGGFDGGSDGGDQDTSGADTASEDRAADDQAADDRAAEERNADQKASDARSEAAKAEAAKADAAQSGYHDAAYGAPETTPNPHEPTQAERQATQDRLEAQGKADKQAYEARTAEALDQEIQAQNAVARTNTGLAIEAAPKTETDLVEEVATGWEGISPAERELMESYPEAFGIPAPPKGGVDAVWENPDGTWSSSDGSKYDPETGERSYDPGEDSFATRKEVTGIGPNGLETRTEYRRDPERIRTSEALALVEHDPTGLAQTYGNSFAFDQYRNPNWDGIRDHDSMTAANRAGEPVSGRYPGENLAYLGVVPLASHLGRRSAIRALKNAEPTANPPSLNRGDFPDISTQLSRQKQNRHIEGHELNKHGGTMKSQKDAEQVLDEWHADQLEVLGSTPIGGFPVVRSPTVTGTNINKRAGYPSQPTDVFMIKGTTSPSVVPMNPNWTP